MTIGWRAIRESVGSVGAMSHQKCPECGTWLLDGKPMYRTGEVARLVGVTPKALQGWLRRNQFHSSYRTMGGAHRFTQDDVDRLLESVRGSE